MSQKKDGTKRLQLTLDELDSAIQLVFKNARRRRCSWHAIYRACERHVGKGGGESTDQYLILSIICRRLHLMTTSVETEVEYIW